MLAAALLVTCPAAAADCAYISDDGWRLEAHDTAEAEYAIDSPTGQSIICTFARSAEGSGVNAECDDGSKGSVVQVGDDYTLAGHTFKRTCGEALDLMGN